MSDDRHTDQSARTLYGVIKVDGAMWRIADAPVMMTRHPSGKTILTVDSTAIRRIGT